MCHNHNNRNNELNGMGYINTSHFINDYISLCIRNYVIEWGKNDMHKSGSRIGRLATRRSNKYKQTEINVSSIHRFIIISVCINLEKKY